MISAARKNLRYSDAEATWVKFGEIRELAFVGRQTIAVASGIFAHFFDCKTRETRIERFDDEERGDGASCLAGHPVVSMFSVAERCASPKVSIFTYPGMKKISSCANDEETSSYLGCTFAGTDHLVGLTSFPSFRIIVWLWRTGERTCAIGTSINDVDRQRIACSPSYPPTISQFAPDTGRLSVYRLLVCCKSVRLFPLDATNPSRRKLVSTSWSTEGKLLVADEVGDAWCLDVESGDGRRILTSGDDHLDGRSPLLLAHPAGLLVATASNSERRSGKLTFYRKSSSLSSPNELTNEAENWQVLWSVSVPSWPVLLERQPRGDRIYLHTENGEIYELTDPARDRRQRPEVLHSDGVRYKMLLSLHGCEGHVGALDTLDRLSILEATTGNLVSSRLRTKHHGKVTHAESHPTMPVVALVSLTGNCTIVDLATPSSPRTVDCFHLQKEPLDRAKFSKRAQLLGVAGSHLGRIFFIARFSGSTRVVGLCEIEAEIVDFLIYEKDTKDETTVLAWKVLILAGRPRSRSSNRILVYSYEIVDECRGTLESTIELPSPLASLHHGVGDDIICIPYLSKQLHRMQPRKDLEGLTLTEALPSLHQSRYIGPSINVESGVLLSCGYDGSVVLRDATNPRRVLDLLAVHHWSEAGVERATIVGRTVVSLGRNGDLVGSKLRGYSLSNLTTGPPHEERTEAFDYAGKRFSDVREEVTGRSWLDASIEARVRSERKRASPVRLSILQDLRRVRDAIRGLLDANDRAEPNCRLPLSVYDVDLEGRRRRTAAIELEEGRTREGLEQQIAKQERALSYLRDRFWTPLISKPRTISFVLGGAERKLRDYSLTEVRSDEEDFRRWCRFSWEMRERVTRWERNEDSSVRGLENLWKGLDALGIQEENECGPYCGYVEALETNALLACHERSTKVRFNELFEEARCGEKRERRATRERVQRIRQCADELGEIFGVKSAALEAIGDVPSRWLRSDENSELVVEETNDLPSTESSGTLSERRNDVASTLSESDESMKFRLDTLERTMDGVLEVRWEDEIRRDVPKPECLVTQDSSSYTEEEIRRARESYEAKLAALEVERRKYRSMLEDEISQSRENLRRSLEAFDDELNGLERQKLVAERSVLRDALSRVRAIVEHRARLGEKREICRFEEEELAAAAKTARDLLEECGALESATIESRARYDNLCKREKLLEGKFRSEFSGELKQPMIEHLLRHYKRRPRLERGGTCTSSTYLTELARCAVANDDSEILPRQCREFLRGLDELDAMPDGLPAQIEPVHWRTMCRLRRIKVETEIKVKCCAVELAEAEQSLSFCQRACQAAKSRASRCRETHRSLERSFVELSEDAEVRSVLRTGQLEVRLCGSLTDLEKAVLVRREDFVRANEAIVRSGGRKLTALSRSMDLRNEIYREEWRHACTRAKMENLGEHLEELRGVKVSRVVRECSSRCVGGTIAEEEARKAERNCCATKDELQRAIERKRDRSLRIAEDARRSTETSDRLAREIERRRNEARELEAAAAAARLRETDLRERTMRMIRRKCELARRARDNFCDLLTLEARLEILKLRTYPTLKFRF